MRARRIAAVLALALAPAVLEARAGAEPTREDRAAGTALFDEGRKLAAAKKYAEACPKFEAAMWFDPGMGTLYNLSDCFEQLGRTASAWSGFREVAAQAKAANLPDREQAARDRAAALEGKLSRVRIVVPAELASTTMTITRDGAQVPSALIGTAIPLDPGPHTIRVVAEGREAFETAITVSPKGGTVDVQVPVLAPKKEGPAGAGTSAPAPSSVASAGPTATAAPTATSPGAPDVSPRPWQKPLGIAATVVGVLGAGAGVALGLVAKNGADTSNKEHCDAESNVCDDEGLKMRDDAVALGNAGTGVFIAGAVIGAAGIVLLITSPSAAPASTPAKSGAALLRPAPKRGGVSDVQVGVGPGNLVVRGRF